jgi:hypothetical protein
MTTGRINQVATRTRGFNRSQGRISSSYSDEFVESVFSIVLLLPIELAFKHSMSPEINLRKQ